MVYKILQNVLCKTKLKNKINKKALSKEMGPNPSSLGEKQNEAKDGTKEETKNFKGMNEKDVCKMEKPTTPVDYAQVEIGKGQVLTIPIPHKDFTCGALFEEV